MSIIDLMIAIVYSSLLVVVMYFLHKIIESIYMLRNVDILAFLKNRKKRKLTPICTGWKWKKLRKEMKDERDGKGGWNPSPSF